jgi:hypothetical protein
MHYSQQEPGFENTQEDGLLRVKGTGLLSVGLLQAALTSWNEAYPDGMPPRLLICLTDVAGYGPGCGTLARDWLRRAHRLGVRKIAFVGSSAVFRTAMRLISKGVRVEMRMFEHEARARRWLGGDLSSRMRERPRAAATL